MISFMHHMPPQFLRTRVTRVVGMSTLFMVLGFGLLVFSPNPDARNSGPAGYQPEPTLTPLYNPTATPPTQGGNGANTFFVYCLSCHGDVGQGLTDEFRFREYPPEDTNCWKSGCHGARPYEQGFTLPMTVPMVIGSGALTKFQTAQDLYGFIRAAMPFNAPGSLSESQYLNLTAFLLEKNQIVPEGAQLNSQTLAAIKLRGSPTAPDQAASPDGSNSGLWLGLIIFVGVATLLSILTRPRRNSDRGSGIGD